MKTFYSAEDIEAMAGQGITELRVDEETVITHLAKDTAQRLGITLVYSAPGSPVFRPGSMAAPSSAPVPGLRRSSAPMAGLRPKGCQHAPLPNSSSGAAQAAGSSDATVTELIGLVRDLADKGRAD
jgi:hypothetical protein